MEVGFFFVHTIKTNKNSLEIFQSVQQGRLRQLQGLLQPDVPDPDRVLARRDFHNPSCRACPADGNRLVHGHGALVLHFDGHVLEKSAYGVEEKEYGAKNQAHKANRKQLKLFFFFCKCLLTSFSICAAKSSMATHVPVSEFVLKM